jgi:DNA-directed RNA polymerase subunit RPC12/RpoP
VENGVRSVTILSTEGSMPTNVHAAPYCDTPIPLYLTSTTGMRYRTLNCMECGAEFLERNNDTMYRLNDSSMPAEIHLNGGSIKARCGKCSQWYGVMVAIEVTYESGGVPLYLQPQSVYIKVDATKKLRYLHCLECGKPFHSISDRISHVTDNRIPFEFADPMKIGPIEALCHSQNCGQTWALML